MNSKTPQGVISDWYWYCYWVDRDICICICICICFVYCTAVLYYYCNYCKTDFYCFDLLSLLLLLSLLPPKSAAAQRLDSSKKRIYQKWEIRISSILSNLYFSSPFKKDRLCNNVFFFLVSSSSPLFFLSFFLSRQDRWIDGWIEVFLSRYFFLFLVLL